jgi:hypothetical protein
MIFETYRGHRFVFDVNKPQPFIGHPHTPGHIWYIESDMLRDGLDGDYYIINEKCVMPHNRHRPVVEWMVANGIEVDGIWVRMRDNWRNGLNAIAFTIRDPDHATIMRLKWY